MNFKRIFICITSLFLTLCTTGQQKDSIVFDRTVLYYYSYGKGEPLILLSGGPGISSMQESDLAEVLSHNYRAVLFDQRGTGLSHTEPFDTSTINLKTAVEDLERLRKHLRLQQLSLSGHSWGGMLAMAYASLYPKRVRLLLLVGSGEPSHQLTPVVNIAENLHRQYSDTAALNYYIKQSRVDTSYATKRELLKLLWYPQIYDRTKIDQVVDQAIKGSQHRKMASLMWQSLDKEKFDFTPGLKKYKGPALILFGWQDPVGLTTVWSIHQAIPQAEVRGINECGHFPSQEQPAIFYPIVLQFLNKHIQQKNKKPTKS